MVEAEFTDKDVARKVLLTLSDSTKSVDSLKEDMMARLLHSKNKIGKLEAEIADLKNANRE